MSRLFLHRSRLAVVAMAACLVGIFFVATSAQARTDHMQRILAISTDPAANAVPTVLGWGPIHAKGTDKVLSDTRDKFVFPRGSIFITHHRQGGGQSQDRATCTFRFWEHGTYRVTRGTGAYAGAHGAGMYHLRALGVSCSRNNPPNPFVLEIHAWGPLYF